MARAALVFVAILVFAGSASAAALDTPTFTHVRICTYATSSFGGCKRDERDTTVRSNALACSYTVSASQAGTVSGYWLYNGVPGSAAKLPYAANSPAPGLITMGTGGRQPLAGSRYTCVLRAGSALATVVIRSSGPTGAIVDAAVCSGTNANRVGTQATFPVCRQNESAKQVAGAGGGSVVCEAVWPDAAGHEASIEMLRDGTVVGSVKFPIDSTLTQGYLERPNKSKPTPLFPGNYTCEFSIVGGPTVTKSFSVVQGAPTPTNAAVEILGELSELRVRAFDVECGPLALLSVIINRDPGMVVLGAARIKGKSMLLDEALVCAPLAAFDAARPRGDPSDAVLLALSVVAHEYGHTLGLERENVVECFAARVVWKWVRREGVGPTALAAARKFILDNSRRPPAYKLLPSCTLPA